MKNSNTFRDVGCGRRWLLRWAIAGLVAVCFEVSASAIDPNRILSQYLYDSWGTDKGFPGGSVSAIVQTADGYLWVGTDKGLIRFDGLSFRRFEQATPGSFEIGPVRALLADAQNNLWMLLQNTKLFRYRDGTFELSRGEAENGITAMGNGKAGTILLSSLAMGTLTYDGKRFLVASAPVRTDSPSQARGEPSDERSAQLSWSTGVMPDRLAAPTSAVISIAATTDGKIWLGTQDKGLFYLHEGRVSAAGKGLPDMKVNCLLPFGNSELWVGTSKGVMRWNGTELTRTSVPSSLLQAEVLSMIRDRDSNIWVGTTRELLRFNANGVSSLAKEVPATAGAVTALFEDREGNVWIGGARGLERLRDSAFVMYSVSSLKSQSMGSLYVDQEGRTWFAPFQGGLHWLKDEKSGSVTTDKLSQDVVYSIMGSRNELWVGRQRGGLTHLRHVHGSFLGETYTQAEGLAQNSVYAVYESRDGTVWAGTLSGGVSELRNGHFSNYTMANGLASNTVSAIAESADGTMWFGTPNGANSLSKGHWTTYRTTEGLPSDDVNCLFGDSAGVLWIGTSKGLGFFKTGHVQVPRDLPMSLREPTLGVAEDKSGWLWIATENHVVRVQRDKLLREMLTTSDVREYGVADGLQSTEGVKRNSSVVADHTGKIWFSTNRGLSVVDPSHTTGNSAPAMAHLELISADNNPITIGASVRILSSHRRITFRYTGLCLAVPERARFRYFLDGFDRGWSEPVAAREAVYTNLGPGSYRFRLVASNCEGLWNGPETSVAFEVEPALWQTWWFRVGCLLVTGALMLLVYRFRLRQLTRQLNVRFEERLAERMRIAQDLHDTLLQGFLSASMQLHVADDRLPANSPVKPMLTRVLDLMSDVIEDGRNTLRGLRSPGQGVRDLDQAFSLIPVELGLEQQINYRVVVEGHSRPLHPVIRDDVYRVGREALVNSFRHAQASNIEVEIEYGTKQLRVLIRDNGTGIDPQVLRSGREGHWGLSGMRERAERIGARLTVWSRPAGGTEVELSVPASIAFEAKSQKGSSRWLAKLHAGKTKTNRLDIDKRAG